MSYDLLTWENKPTNTRMQLTIFEKSEAKKRVLFNVIFKKRMSICNTNFLLIIGGYSP
jgi:hypothetical protein